MRSCNAALSACATIFADELVEVLDSLEAILDRAFEERFDALSPGPTSSTFLFSAGSFNGSS